MNESFKDHKLSESERLWLHEVYESFVTGKEFDSRIAKVNLRDKLPKGFNPNAIDQRLLRNGKDLTFIGIWHIDPESRIFADYEKIILTIKNLIIEKPGIEIINAEEISKKTGIDKTSVEVAFKSINTLGRSFYSSASGSPESKGYSQIKLSSDYAYDAYLDFENIENLLDEYYTKFGKPQEIVFTPLKSPMYSFSSVDPFTIDYPISRQEIKQNTAFVIMAMERSKPELTDVYEAIKEVCGCFGIAAYRADEIEHSDRITDRILDEIKTCEFLIADLTYERPNVYYEIGYAHAFNKRPILYKKQGTQLHFDLSVHNVPEYSNVTELKEKLTKRLETILGRSVKKDT